MIDRGRGHIVGVASMAGYRGLPWMISYSASKAALIAYLEALRPGLARRGITVTTVCPGFVRTAMSTGSPLQRPVKMLEPEEAARHLVRAVLRRPRNCVFPWSHADRPGRPQVMPDRLFDWMMDGRARGPDHGILSVRATGEESIDDRRACRIDRAAVDRRAGPLPRLRRAAAAATTVCPGCVASLPDARRHPRGDRPARRPQPDRRGVLRRPGLDPIPPVGTAVPALQGGRRRARMSILRHLLALERPDARVLEVGIGDGENLRFLPELDASTASTSPGRSSPPAATASPG